MGGVLSPTGDLEAVAVVGENTVGEAGEEEGDELRFLMLWEHVHVSSEELPLLSLAWLSQLQKGSVPLNTCSSMSLSASLSSPSPMLLTGSKGMLPSFAWPGTRHLRGVMSRNHTRNCQRRVNTFISFFLLPLF